MDKKIGFIGAGNMGQAMIKGIISSGILSSEDIFAADLNENKLKKLRALDVSVARDAMEFISEVDILILSVKPHIYKSVLESISDRLSKDILIITIAAGIDLKFMNDNTPAKQRIIRTMPNTPALVGEGMTAMCPNEYATEIDTTVAVEIFESFGKVEVVKEYLIDSVIGIAGSSPAYVFKFIEAMADGAVKDGMPRNQAYKFAAQAVLGSAKMVLETGIHPAELKDMVTSPGGTTIEAVAELDKKGFSGTVISAVEKCIEKSKQMTKG